MPVIAGEGGMGSGAGGDAGFESSLILSIFFFFLGEGGFERFFSKIEKPA